MWTVAISKKVPSGKLKSVTASRCSRPSISSQYSSEVSLFDAGELSFGSIRSNATSRLSAAERILEASAPSVSRAVPSGRVMQAAGSFPPADGTPTRVALKSKRVGLMVSGDLLGANVIADRALELAMRENSRPGNFAFLHQLQTIV